MRLIDADRIKFEVFGIIENYSLNPVYPSEYKRGWNDAVNALEQQIAELPTVERPHGKIIVDEDGNTSCSRCGNTLAFGNFCCNCGADFREEKENETGN